MTSVNIPIDKRSAEEVETGAHQLRKQHVGFGLGKPNFDEVTAKGEVKCASLRWVSGKVWVRMKPFVGEKT
jgi:hypothetical protein